MGILDQPPAAAADARIAAKRGAAGGIAALGSDQRVPDTQLPAYLGLTILTSRYKRDVSPTDFTAERDDLRLAAAVAAGDAEGYSVFVPRGAYTFGGTVDVSGIAQPLRITIEKGAVITQTVDLPAFKAWGSHGAWSMITANIAAGTRTCFVSSPNAALFAPGDWIAVAANNTIPGSSDKIGMLRRIEFISGNQITFDAAAYRQFNQANSGHINKVTFVPSVQIVGGGQIKHSDPANMFQPMIHFAAVDSPLVDVELGPGGGTGFAVSWSLRGGTGRDFHAHDLVDDEPGGHFGYGINNGGGNRNMRFLGRSGRVRHAHSTGPGANMPNSNTYGEPESCVIDMETYSTTNKALDTHRQGWDLTFIPHHQGGAGGGFQFRSDNTHAIGGTISGTNTVGGYVSSSVQIPGKISGVVITDTAGAGAVGLWLDGPARVDNCDIRRFTGVGMRLNAQGCIVNNVIIDGVAAGTLTGVEILQPKQIITLGQISNVSKGFSIASSIDPATIQRSTVAFGDGVTTQVA